MLKAYITRLFILSCCLLLATPHLFAAELALETQTEKESYSIGYQVGLSMKTDGVEIDFERLIQGLQDAIDAKEPRLSTEEMRKLIVDLKKRARDAQMRKIQEQIVENAAESEKFLEANKKKAGIKTTASGLQYRVLKPGDGMAPGPEDFVTVNYRGTFIDGKEFDSSYAKGEPIRVQVDGVIKGWTEALPMMKPGAKWQLFVPPHLGYGRGGSGRIPPNKVLVFEMELLAVEKEDPADQASKAQTSPKGTVRQMSVTGEIGKSRHGYIIRGKQPQMIWTILNPEPKILDTFVKSEKIVPIEIRIVSGDNVNIEKIDGKAYHPGTPQTATVRQMNITGEIGKSRHGYIIRGKQPSSMIWTILNPEPKILDGFVKSEKTVPIQIRIVSGDNVNIEKIDGKQYGAEKGTQAVLASQTQTGAKGTVRQMSITGEIGKSQHGYIIRGKQPQMIWTILNPDPNILDAFVKSEKIVPIEVRIVSGDNVNIEKIDGKAYRPGTPQTATVRKMNITGEIAKAAHGYIIRGKQPQMIWTILNPEPNILDAFVKSEKTVPIAVRIVSGDNVNIEKIDGKEYR